MTKKREKPLHVMLNEDDLSAFKAKCDAAGMTMREAIEGFVQRFYARSTAYRLDEIENRLKAVEGRLSAVGHTLAHGDPNGEAP